MINIKLFPKVGSFAENKDAAREIRLNEIIPALEAHKEVTLDFQKIDSATQSFVHALISDLIRNYGADVLDKISFKNCSDTIKEIVKIVVEYMQESK